MNRVGTKNDRFYVKTNFQIIPIFGKYFVSTLDVDQFLLLKKWKVFLKYDVINCL